MQVLDLAPKWTRYIPHPPHQKQQAFLMLDCQEALYGGSAGGGKSDALLMAALQYVDVPGYAAILFRRRYTDLSLPGALMDKARDWLGGSDAHWSEQAKTWTFPSGATLTFGYLDTHNDKYRYQSAEFQFVGFDELTQFPEVDYRYLFSRLRRPSVGGGGAHGVPLRMRSASNPGGVGHDWVKQRFVVGPSERVFIPARLADNPSLDAKTYIQGLDQLDPITRQQLLNGDWTARQGGEKFRREWFDIVETYPEAMRSCRYWDLAATVPEEGSDPDWTCGVRVGSHTNGLYYITDVQKFRLTPMYVEERILRAAQMDGMRTAIRMEQEPGASGVNTIDHYARRVLLGYDFRGIKTTGEKADRANPVASAAERKQVKIVQGIWNGPFLDELESFPVGAHDDQVDAMSGAFSELATTVPFEQAIRF